MKFRFMHIGLVVLALECMGLSAMAYGAKIHHSPTAHHHAKSKHLHRVTARSHRMHGQQAIAPERATQIQQALIREHYLTGDPSGQWDATTQAAMVKFQADNGWQTKLAPDSRALIKLGLGPDHSGAMNGNDSAHSTLLPTPDPSVDSDCGLIAASGVNH